MKALHIVGSKQHGKTTLVVDLLRELTGRGLRVGTTKHCGHDHELDSPDKDSFQHREAGATAVAVVTPGMMALYVRDRGDSDPYDYFRSSFGDCDLVLIEGHISGPGPKIEVWRAALGTPPRASGRDDILGIVTDDPLDIDLPLYSRKDVAALAEKVQTLAADI
ncbi:MAG: molybdopterin-guanine dinucleotide biosynthesis protein B [Candidatus Hydrogenedentes bacterium]|nr:molybdopterin-guanine dinucleotide biosynthesis protein B [Candidatus Hydrogenedentota bacterium]